MTYYTWPDICQPKVLTSLPGVLRSDLPECPWKIRTEDSMTMQRQIDDDRPLAELRGAVKKYGAVTALAGVDFAVQPGEVVALLGPNGAGKTTAVQLPLGFLRPSGGQVPVFRPGPRSTAARVP